MGVLALITLLAAATRGFYLAQPMLHDEAYTFIAFASRPLLPAISDYALPNNHIFHTLLVYLAYHLLGNQPWIIRLPAFVAGVAIVPLAYAAGAIFYNRKAGLLSAGIVAAAPLLINYSANARGYTLVCALTLCAAALAAYVKDHRNRIAWALLALTCALGFYTIPIMLYPAGMLVVWLALSGLFKDIAQDYRRAFWGYLLGACLLLVGLTALLYTPVFIKSGIGAVVNNSYVRPDDPATLAEQVESRVASTAEQWTSGAPWGMGAAFPGGICGVAGAAQAHLAPKSAAASRSAAVDRCCPDRAAGSAAGAGVDVPAAALHHLGKRRAHRACRADPAGAVARSGKVGGIHDRRVAPRRGAGGGDPRHSFDARSARR